MHRILTSSTQQAADVAAIVKVTNHIVQEVNDLKKMSSQELTKTLGVLKNLTERIQHFNTTEREAKELITVRVLAEKKGTQRRTCDFRVRFYITL